MDNIMDTLITDRTQADVDRARYLNGLWDPRALQWRGTPQERAEWEAGPRGAYGFADMNRVTQAAAYLIGQLEELGYSVDIEDVTPAYNIQVSVDPAGGGTASGAGVYYEGDTATVAAQAGEKYDFAGWKENGQLVSDSASYTFTVTSPRNLTAAFALKKFQVTVSVDPPGAGEVTGAGTYDIDTEVTVAATAGDGYVFAHWAEGGETVSDGPQYTFTLDRDRSLSAAMTKTYVISVTASDSDGGTVSGGGTYLDGQTVTVAAVAGDGYEFAGWTEGGTTVSTEAVYTFQAAADRELVAVFVKTYIITLLVDPAGGGTALGGGTYREGAQVTISAAAGDGYRFASWQSGGEQVSTSNPYTLTVSEDQTLTALFEEIPVYTITAAISPEGSGTVTGAGQYREGATVTLVAAPADGYNFSGWQEGGQTVSADTTYSFTTTANRALTASFGQKQVIILPSGYTLIEYIESPSTMSGINTGFNVNFTTMKVFMDIKPNSVIYSGGESIFSATLSSAVCYSYRYSTYIRYALGPASNKNEIPIDISLDRVSIKLDLENKTFEIGDNSYQAAPDYPYSVTGSLCFLRSTSASSRGMSTKIYSAQIYDGDDLKRDFVPCTNPSGIAGLYDLVEGNFYQSIYETSPFTAGPAV